MLAFRLQQHNLISRRPAADLLAVADACGIRNSPPGSAELSFQIRLQNFKVAQLETALSTEKSLLESWSIRSSPFIFPSQAITVFTLGLLPDQEADLGFCLKAVLPSPPVMTLQALEWTATAMREVLDGEPLAKGELSTKVSQRVPPAILKWCKGCDAYHVNESLFRLAAQKAQLCFVPRSGGLKFVRADQWLPDFAETEDLSQARSEILQRYLHGYGPSNPTHFATWAGISLVQAKAIWQLIEAELVEVSFESNKGWVLAEDLALLESPPEPQGVRLIPPYDPYLLLSDRTTLLPDKFLHNQVWRVLGNPGIVLVTGEAIGIWRTQKNGKRLLLTLTTFEPFPPVLQAELEQEAQLLAMAKGCSTVDLSWEN